MSKVLSWKVLSEYRVIDSLFVEEWKVILLSESERLLWIELKVVWGEKYYLVVGVEKIIYFKR